MLVKTITYTDFNGNERTEDFYFNLTKAEVVDWITTTQGYTYDEALREMVRKNNTKGVMQALREIIRTAYGEKSPDGRRFIKTDEVKSNFMDTEAYSVLFMELLSDSKAALDFCTGIMPADMADAVAEIRRKHPNASTEELISIMENERASENPGSPIPIESARST